MKLINRLNFKQKTELKKLKMYVQLITERGKLNLRL